MSETMPAETLAREFASLVQGSMWVTTPEYAGWLMKRSSGWLGANAIFRSRAWKRKWVSLHGTELMSMDNEPDHMDNMVAEDSKIRRSQLSADTMVVEDDSDSSAVPGYGFCVRFNTPNTPDWHFKAETPEEKANWMVKIGQVHAITSWMRAFEKVRVVGTGAQGTVYELRHVESGKRFAMKEMEIKSEKQMKMAISEAQFLKTIVETVSHPNILYIEKVFQVGSKFYLVFPLCTGGELYDAVVTRGHYSEHDTAMIMRDLISALHALHENNILHLDIKPENILFDKPDVNGNVKVNPDPNTFDHNAFEEGLKKFVAKGVLETEGLRGTFGYMSPEVIILQLYTKAADVFAAGVVLYILLCGYPPFASKSLRQTLLRTVKGSYKMEGTEWDKISNDAKDLLRKMLTIEPTHRITTSEILQHPWILAVQQSDPQTAIAHQPTDIPELNQLSITPPTPHITSVENITKLSKENLTDTLSRLAEHVRSLKTSKLASTMTKFLSAAGPGGVAGESRLAKRFLVDKEATFSQPEQQQHQPGEEEATAAPPFVLHQSVMTLTREEVRSALARTLFHLFGDPQGRMTVEQLVGMRTRLGITPSHLAGGTNLGDLLLIHRLDRDGDGLISAQDILNAQSIVFQQSDQLLQSIFRIYAEAIWYPGKRINYYHAMQTLQQQRAATVTGSGELPTPMKDTSSTTSALTPRHITEKNVAAVFERLGYDPEGGRKAFTILCEALRRIQPTIPEETTDEAEEEEAVDRRSAPSTLEHTAVPRKDRMDVQDFMRAARLDNILVQVMFRRSQEIILHIAKRSEERLHQLLSEQPDLKEEVALYAIVEEEVRAQMQRASTTNQQHQQSHHQLV
eukprot:gene8337-9187_t